MSSGYALHPEAFRDLDDIRDYIAQEDPDAADRVMLEIFDTIRGWRTRRAFCDVCGWPIPPLARITAYSNPKDLEGSPHALEVLVTCD